MSSTTDGGREPLAACPKCGGISGYQHRFHMAFTMAGEWGTSPGRTGEENVMYRPKHARCIDCNARIRIDIATDDERWGLDE